MKTHSWWLAFAAIWVIFSFQFFFLGRIPAPLDLLVNFFAPWDKYYDFPVKNPAITDVVNQIIPWKTFTADSWRRGEVPLWNSYNLAGAPHLANWQSAVLYPTNLLFLFLPFNIAWSFHILSQPLFAGLFMILFLRSLDLSKVASLLGGLAFAYGGFMTTWLEWGTLGHALLWLPLALYGIEQGRRPKAEGRRLHKWTAIIIIISWVMSLLAGHLQVSIYVIATSFCYFLFRNWKIYQSTKLKLIIVSCFLFLVSSLIAAPQILPSINLFINSYRNTSFDPEWFKAFRIPVYGLMTFLAPDFFGNPVTRNHWSDHSYIEMMGYIGVVPLMFAAYSLINIRSLKIDSRRVLKFFLGVVAVGLLLSLKTPIANIILSLKIPILASSSPARIIGIVSFALVVLSAYGFDQAIEGLKKKKLFRLRQISGVFIIFFLGMWAWSFMSSNPNALIARHNLIFPTIIFITSTIGWLSIHKLNPFKPSLFLVSCFLFITFIDLFRFHYKFTPFAEAKYFYPQIPAIKYLRENPARTFGLFDANLNLPFLIPSIEGYDPLVLRNYVKYASSAETGEEQLPARTSAVQLPKNGKRTMAILNELGVKYVVQPTVHGAQPWELRLWEYADQFKLLYQDDQYEVYENMLAREPIGPNDSLIPVQNKLFYLGITLSGLAVIGTLIWYKHSNYV